MATPPAAWARVKAQHNTPRAVSHAEPTRWDFRARSNGRTYRLEIVDLGGRKGATPRPVVVVLDGNAYAPMVAAAARSLTHVARDIVPPIVVGVGYPNDLMSVWMTERTFDLTPAEPPAFMPVPSGSRQRHGGLDRFMDMLVNDLPECLGERWPIDRARSAVFGHSLGGLAVVHLLLTHPEAFGGWIAVSPSLWFDQQLLARREKNFSRHLPASLAACRLHVSVGGLEQSIPTKLPAGHGEAGAAELKRLVSRTRMIDNARGFAERMQSRLPQGRQVRFERLTGQDHITAPFAAICKALRFTLNRPGSCEHHLS